tara:strand:+ start:165 stop:1142 length:978 start_codon:yes stop_codon:yes gene_type:complete
MSKKMAKKVSPDKHKTMTITYDWNGGELTRNLTFPRVDLSYISPGSSDGIEDINFSGKNFEGSDLSYSNFFNCNFRNTNMKNVKMDKSNFRGSDFTGATGLNAKQKRIIKNSGGILDKEEHGLSESPQKKSPQKKSPKQRSPKQRSPKKKVYARASPDKRTKSQSITIEYDWDGGMKTRILSFPKVDLSYISPANSEGIFNEDFSGLNFEDSDLSYSNFVNCDFKGTNMINVKMDKSNFRGSDFRGAVGLNTEQIKQIKGRGGILDDEDDKILKSQLKRIRSLALNYNKCKAKCEAIKKEIFEITESNPAHGDSVEVTNTYKIFG